MPYNQCKSIHRVSLGMKKEKGGKFEVFFAVNNTETVKQDLINLSVNSYRHVLHWKSIGNQQ